MFLFISCALGFSLLVVYESECYASDRIIQEQPNDTRSNLQPNYKSIQEQPNDTRSNLRPNYNDLSANVNDSAIWCMAGLNPCLCRMNSSFMNAGHIEDRIRIWKTSRNHSKITLETLMPDEPYHDDQRNSNMSSAASNDDDYRVKDEPKEPKCLHDERQVDSITECYTYIWDIKKQDELTHIDPDDDLSTMIDKYFSFCDYRKNVENTFYVCRCKKEKQDDSRRETRRHMNIHVRHCALIDTKNCTSGMIEIPDENLTSYNITDDVEIYVITPVVLKLTSMCLDDSHRKGRDNEDFFSDPVTLQVLDFIFSIVSLLSLLMTIFVFATCPELRNLHGKSLLSLSVTLFFSQIMFLRDIGVGSVELCSAIGGALHYCWLSNFNWTSVMAYDLARTFRQKSSVNLKQVAPYIQSKQYRRYAYVAWGLPVLIVMVCLVINVNNLTNLYSSPTNVRACMVNYPALIYALVVPFSISCIFNIGCFVVIVHGIETKTNTKTNRHRNRYDRTRCFVYLKLWFMLGLSWIICIIASLNSSTGTGLWFTFSITTNLHSIGIFTSFYLMNRRVRGILRKRLSKGNSADNSPLPNVEKTFNDLNEENTAVL